MGEGDLPAAEGQGQLGQIGGGGQEEPGPAVGLLGPHGGGLRTGLPGQVREGVPRGGGREDGQAQRQGQGEEEGADVVCLHRVLLSLTWEKRN